MEILVLDAGSGFGNMSKTAVDVTDGKIHITLYDPLVPMLQQTSKFFDKKPNLASGVFEHIPFKMKSLMRYYAVIHFVMQLI